MRDAENTNTVNDRIQVYKTASTVV